MSGITTIILLFIVFFSIIVHEFSHGYAAYLNGDDTARMMGRLTFNPIPHIDPIGTLLLPIILILIKSPIVIGMAKPVPINPFNFKNYDRGLLEVGLAGPVSNMVLGTVFAFLTRFIAYGLVKDIMLFASRINFMLAFFNLVPVPPLDGSRVLSVFLPRNLRYHYEQIEKYGLIIVLAVLLFGGFEWLFPLSSRIVYFIAGK